MSNGLHDDYEVDEAAQLSARQKRRRRNMRARQERVEYLADLERVLAIAGRALDAVALIDLPGPMRERVEAAIAAITKLNEDWE